MNGSQGLSPDSTPKSVSAAGFVSMPARVAFSCARLKERSSLATGGDAWGAQFVKKFALKRQ